ncbi:MAG: hypothetical protein IJW71_01710 [Clostridia bacterium]|nr:hypothetical protein [Clostridia bacterium]
MSENETRDEAPLPEAAETESESEPVLSDAEEPVEQAVDYEALAASDLAQIKARFPAMQHLSHLSEIENAVRYGELRDAGLSVEEAFLATNYERLGRRTSDNRTHLSGSMPRQAAAPVGRMSYGELCEARALFDGLSDREIEALWRRTHQ